MNENFWNILVILVYIIAIVGVSVLFRRFKGEPIFPKMPSDALFSERGCSGRSFRNVLSRIGGANNCLLVVVRDKTLMVVPQFPFNLMFIPEIYGLDVAVPVSSIAGITPITRFFRKTLRVEFISGGPADMELVVRNEASFINAIGREVVRNGNREISVRARNRNSGKIIAIRVFFAIWGTGALFGGLMEGKKDLRYRSEAATTMATYVYPDEYLDGQTKMGVLVYAVEGKAYRMTSIYGIGMFSVDDKTTVYYFPSNPKDAREKENLYFDFIWIGAGIFTLSISIFFGFISRILW